MAALLSSADVSWENISDLPRFTRIQYGDREEIYDKLIGDIEEDSGMLYMTSGLPWSWWSEKSSIARAHAGETPL